MSEFRDDPLAPLLDEYARHHDPAVRDEIVLASLHLVEQVARRYRLTGEPVDDLVQEGTIGLINAVELFDAGRGVKFSTYASHQIHGAIQHYVRDKGKLIREPGWLHELNQRINRVLGALRQRHGREPTADEVAQELGLPLAQVSEALRAREVFQVRPLELPPGEEGGEAEPERTAEAPAAGFPVEERLALEEALRALRQSERAVIHEFFYNDLSKAEIARKLKLTPTQVSHLLRRGLKQLKQSLLTEERLLVQQQLRSVEGQLVEAQHRAEAEARRDGVTGLYNRRYLLSRLEEEILRAQRYRLQVSVCAMALVGLDSYAEAFGEADAERAEAQVADLLLESSQRIDLVGHDRFGRFLLVLPQTGLQAVKLCQRVRRAVGSHRFRADDHTAARLRVRCGLAVHPDHGDDPAALVECAERTLAAALQPDAEPIQVAPAP